MRNLSKILDAVQPRLIVDLEDRGQDFLRFEVNSAGVILSTFPFQGWVWNGCKIQQKRIRNGMKLRLRRGRSKPMTLRYRVRAVTRDSRGPQPPSAAQKEVSHG